MTTITGKCDAMRSTCDEYALNTNGATSRLTIHRAKCLSRIMLSPLLLLRIGALPVLPHIDVGHRDNAMKRSGVSRDGSMLDSSVTTEA